MNVEIKATKSGNRIEAVVRHEISFKSPRAVDRRLVITASAKWTRRGGESVVGVRMTGTAVGRQPIVVEALPVSRMAEVIEAAQRAAGLTGFDIVFGARNRKSEDVAFAIEDAVESAADLLDGEVAEAELRGL